MKGIILAGGSGTRLYPITEGISKQLVNVYDKPMIFYPLSVLMEAGIRDILVITTDIDQPNFKRLLGDGSKFGINITYEVQYAPNGLAEAFLIGEDFIGNDECAMILGDNIFYGRYLKNDLQTAMANANNGYATIFGNRVTDPERFGIMEVNDKNEVLSVEEKPLYPKSNIAITGLYFYPKGVSKYAHNVKPSKRNELEITTLNDMYLQEKILKAIILESGCLWFDTGTEDSLIEAANMIKTVESNQGIVVCCPEAIGYYNGWLSKEELSKRAELLSKNKYGKYLKRVKSNK